MQAHIDIPAALAHQIREAWQVEHHEFYAHPHGQAARRLASTPEAGWPDTDDRDDRPEIPTSSLDRHPLLAGYGEAEHAPGYPARCWWLRCSGTWARLDGLDRCTDDPDYRGPVRLTVGGRRHSIAELLSPWWETELKGLGPWTVTHSRRPDIDYPVPV